MNSPEVSIIIPVYNREKLLEETLNNILNQSFTKWECILIDDGSTDNSIPIINKYCSNDKRFKAIFQKNSGPSIARNKGIKAALGKYIQFQDSDDFFEVDKLKVHVDFLENHSEIDIVYGDVRYFTNEDYNKRMFGRLEKDKDCMPKVSGKGKELMKLMIKRGFAPFKCFLIRKSKLNKLTFFDESLRQGEDFLFNFNLAYYGVSFQYLEYPNTCLLVRSHDDRLAMDRWAATVSHKKLFIQLGKKLKDKDLKKSCKQRAKIWSLKMIFVAIKEHIKGNNSHLKEIIKQGNIFERCFSSLSLITPKLLLRPLINYVDKNVFLK